MLREKSFNSVYEGVVLYLARDYFPCEFFSAIVWSFRLAVRLGEYVIPNFS